jgi:hypothetical protein
MPPDTESPEHGKQSRVKIDVPEEFPSLAKVERLSDLLCEGKYDEVEVTPEEVEAAANFKNDLIHRLRTTAPEQWPKLEIRRRMVAESNMESAPRLIGMEAP